MTKNPDCTGLNGSSRCEREAMFKTQVGWLCNFCFVNWWIRVQSGQTNTRQKEYQMLLFDEPIGEIEESIR